MAALFCVQTFAAVFPLTSALFWLATLLMDHAVDGINPSTRLAAEVVFTSEIRTGFEASFRGGPSNLWSVVDLRILQTSAEQTLKAFCAQGSLDIKEFVVSVVLLM